MVVLDEANLPTHPVVESCLVVGLVEAAPFVVVYHGLVEPDLVVDAHVRRRLRRKGAGAF